MTIPTKSTISKIIISSDDRNLSAIYIGDPDNWSGCVYTEYPDHDYIFTSEDDYVFTSEMPEIASNSENLFINIGNGKYTIPTELFCHPQSWRDSIESTDPRYIDNETYFSNIFTQKDEIWNVTHFYKNDRGDGGYRDVIRYRIKYIGEPGKNLFELMYKIYTLKVYIYDNDGGDLDNNYYVKSYENDGNENYEKILPQELELEPLTF